MKVMRKYVMRNYDSQLLVERAPNMTIGEAMISPIGLKIQWERRAHSVTDLLRRQTNFFFP